MTTSSCQEDQEILVFHGGQIAISRICLMQINPEKLMYFPSRHVKSWQRALKSHHFLPFEQISKPTVSTVGTSGYIKVTKQLADACPLEK
jgi:hypothetical protein